MPNVNVHIICNKLGNVGKCGFDTNCFMIKALEQKLLIDLLTGLQKGSGYIIIV